jgi:integrase
MSKQLFSFAQLAGQFQRVKVGTLLWLRKAQLNKAGTAPIHLRIFIGPDRIEHSTGIRVAPEAWDSANGRILGKGKLVQQQNEQLQLLKAHVPELVNLMKATGRKISIGSIRRELVAPTVSKSPCFMELCDSARALEKEASPALYDRSTAVLKVLADWNGRDKEGTPYRLPLDEFTPRRATEFYVWMQTVRKVKISTANANISRLESLFKRVVELEQADINDNPFRTLRKKKADAPASRLHLSHQQLADLREVELTGLATLARDIYLAQYYLHGSRIGAVLTLQWVQVSATQVQFKAEKGGPRKTVNISPELARILARYQQVEAPASALVFPCLPAAFHSLSVADKHAARAKAIHRVNFQLSSIAKKLGIEGYLSSHTARHTLAAHAAQLGGLEVAQGMLGHSSAAMTAHYAGPLHNPALAAVEQALYGSGAEPTPPTPSPPDEGGKVLPLWKGGEAA